MTNTFFARLRVFALILAVQGLVFSAAVSADEVRLKEGYPDKYYVKPGDTLWDIASRFLESPWQWPEIWQLNDEIENPHLIYPGDVLEIVFVNGRPQMNVQRGTVKLVPDAQADRISDVPMEPETPEEVAKTATLRLTPKARVVPLGTAIPAVPLEAIQSYLSETRVVTRAELETAPRILAAQDHRLVAGVGDRVYVRDYQNKWKTTVPTYDIYRGGAEYVDPDTGEVLGLEAMYLGKGSIVGLEDEIATVKLTETVRDVRVDDRLIAREERKVDAIFYPKGPADKIEGKIIRVYESIAHVGQYDVVVINRGQRDGIEEGHVLSIYRDGELVKDRDRLEYVQMPAEKAGLMMVFRTFDRVSYGLVLKASKPLRLGDIVKNPTYGY